MYIPSPLAGEGPDGGKMAPPTPSSIFPYKEGGTLWGRLSLAGKGRDDTHLMLPVVMSCRRISAATAAIASQPTIRGDLLGREEALHIEMRLQVYEAQVSL